MRKLLIASLIVLAPVTVLAQATVPWHQGSIPWHQGSIPWHQGSIPWHQGSVPWHQGSVPWHQIGAPWHQASVSPIPTGLLALLAGVAAIGGIVAVTRRRLQK